MSGSPRPRKELRATAYHEAGHAVAHFALGRRIDRVSIHEDADRLGHTRGRVLPPDEWFAGGRTLYDVPTKTVEDELVALFAGPAAENRFRQRGSGPAGAFPTDAFPAGAFDDYEAVAEIAVGAQPSDAVRDAWIGYLRALAARLLDVHWYLVEAVAAALLARETLSGPGVHRVIRAAIVEAEPKVLPLSKLVRQRELAHWWRKTAAGVGAAKLYE